MPYIITTYTTEEREPDLLPLEDTRTAVATLDEARTAAYAIIRENAVGQSGDAWHRAANQVCTPAWPHVGGTVGPLPDGTVIEVRPASWMDLKIHTDLPGDPHGLLSDSAILAAFNVA